MDAVALTAGENPNFLLLVWAGKVKGGNISTGVDLPSAEFERISSLRNFLVDGLLRVKRARLVYISQLNGLANFDGTAVRFLLTDDHLEQGRLASTVRTHNTDDRAGRNGGGKGIQDETVVEGLVTSLNSKTTSPSRG